MTRPAQSLSASAEIGPEDTILVLHAPEVDAAAFISRLIASPATCRGNAGAPEAVDSTTSGSGAGDDIDASGSGAGAGADEPLTERASSSSSTTRWAWTIDNKYYTARVAFISCSVSAPSPSGVGVGVGVDAPTEEAEAEVETHDEVPVVVFLFEDQPPQPLPPQLTRLITASPRDIALAVRVRPGPGPGPEAGSETRGFAPLFEDAKAAAEEAFDELGMELVDECAGAAADDERPIDALEQLRQTLQTHMWPGMVRKPMGARGGGASALDSGSDGLGSANSDDAEEFSHELAPDEDYEDSGSEYSDEAHIAPSPFPVTFTARKQPALSKQDDGVADAGADDVVSNDDDDDDDDHAPPRASFPSPRTLLAQLEAISAPNRIGGAGGGTDPEAAAAAGRGMAQLREMNAQLALAGREFAQLRVEREMAAERRLARFGAMERRGLEWSDDEGEGEGGSESDDEGWDEDGDGGGWARLEGSDEGEQDDGRGLGESDGEEISFGASRDVDHGAGPAPAPAASGPSTRIIDPDDAGESGGWTVRAKDQSGGGKRPGPSADAAEWARFERWLRADEVAGAPAAADLDLNGLDEEDMEGMEDIGMAQFLAHQRAARSNDGADVPGPNSGAPALEDARDADATQSHAPSRFEDDFADFQSGPAPLSSGGAGAGARGLIPKGKKSKAKAKDKARNKAGSHFPPLPLDPTPLLLHLQSLRAELAQVPDGDERGGEEELPLGGM